ncbi:MAG: hypothetical protein JWP19_2188 [Rhodoglobus sp.]|nr:hypothetical protein [Rhodoglobus sp.]
MPRPGPRRQPVAVRFAPDEIEAMTRVAEARGITISDLLREAIKPPMPEHELEKLDSDTLYEMYLQNHRVFVTQRDDPAPKGMATLESIWEPVMSSRLEDILVRRGVYPGIDVQNAEDRLRQ